MGLIQSPYSLTKFITKNAASHTSVCYNQSSSTAKDLLYTLLCNLLCASLVRFPISHIQVASQLPTCNRTGMGMKSLSQQCQCHCASAEHEGKTFVSLQPMLKSIRYQGKADIPIPTEGKCSQLCVRHQMLEKCKVSNVPACTVLPTGNFLTHLLNCSGLHSHASLSLIPMRGAQLCKSSLFHSRDLKIKYCNTWLVQQEQFS